MGSRSAELRRARPLLGTTVEIVVREGSDAAFDAISAAFAAIEEVQRQMSFHDPASTLSRLNREAARHPVRVEPWTLEVLTAARELFRGSQGIFDVSIGSRLQQMRFLPGDPPEGAVMDFSAVEWSGDGDVSFTRRGLQLDFGGIAKGFAVDQAIAVLRAAGLGAGLVNAGGDVRAFGAEPWVISIRHPEAPGRTLATANLREAALATSAHYFAGYLVPGATQAPIMHPRREECEEASARPRSVTVRAASAMIADALTKVVMLDAEAALPLLEQHGADAFFVSPQGEVVCSKNWNATLHLSS